MTLNNLLLPVLTVLISFAAFPLHAAYKLITAELPKRNIFFRLRTVTLMVAVIGMIAVWVRIFDNLLGYDVTGLVPIIILFVALGVNFSLILSTVFSRQCRYRITYFVKHPNTVKVVALLLAFLGILWIAFKAVAQFFFRAVANSPSHARSRSYGPQNRLDEQADIESGAKNEPTGYYDLDGNYRV